MDSTTLGFIIVFLSGGTFGSIITIGYQKWAKRIQKIECHYIEDDIISKLPIQSGLIVHNNIYTKGFTLINTSNTDQIKFTIIFEFDISAKILSHDNHSKDGQNKHKSKLTKNNECSVTIKHFNRKDKIKFSFQIANITSDKINITESECTGLKIVTKDKRSAKKPSKLTFVAKSELSSIPEGTKMV
jgi:hypothetical protein